MHYTLHLTSDCNLACHYCYVHKMKKKRMTPDTAKAALDRGAKRGENIGIAFFGGEPLLEKQLIYDTVAYGREVEEREGCHFHFKITTNGMLLDDDFLRWCSENRVMIALSIDGTREAHDAHRRTAGGGSSYEDVERAAKRLLKYQPYACAMMVINPDTVQYYADGVQKLMDLGFQYYICSLNYEPEAGWTDKHMEALERQFARLADMYVRWTLDERKFYFSPFEVKMRSHIDGEGYCPRALPAGHPPAFGRYRRRPLPVRAVRRRRPISPGRRFHRRGRAPAAQALRTVGEYERRLRRVRHQRALQPPLWLPQQAGNG